MDTTIRGWSFWIVLGGLAACGGSASQGEEGSSAPFTSGLPDEEALDQLGDAGVGTFCAAVEDYVAANLDPGAERRGACVAAAWALGQGEPATCQQFVDDCLTKPASQTGQCNPAIGTCGITVGAAEACLTARVAQVNAVLPRFECSLLADPAAVQQLQNDAGAIPAECTTVLERCPQLDAS